MYLFVSGVNHKRAPVHVRESLAKMNGQLEDSVTQLMTACPVREAVILSTCNRFEVYGVTDQEAQTPDFVRPFFTSRLGLDAESFRNHFYFLGSGSAVEHLLEVISSLDSMVLGEAQILHQVKEAFRIAASKNATGKMLNKLFQKAFEIGKRVRAETAIGRNAVSVSFAGVELARKIFGTLEGKTAMVVGVGEMSQLTIGHLVDHGVRHVLVTNRTYQNAVNLAARHGGEAVEFDRFPERLPEVDILISSTAASGYILKADEVRKAMARRKQQPVLMVDIAVPRDIDPEVGNVSNVYLYNIDDLQSVVDRNLGEREQAARQARRIVQEGKTEFLEWLQSLQVVPVIEGLMARAEQIAEDELSRAMARLTSLSEHDRNIVRAALRGTTNKLLHLPLKNLKKLSQESNAAQALELVRDLFELRPGGETAPNQGEKH
ncbi:MAG: glutamyl-tRNA reductase [Candidatus Wallbacteria bacterium]|nr:glutamyl-tRNA reductase [Candidatus Wallbacteria bacterium]